MKYLANLRAVICAIMVAASPVAAQEFSGLARLDVEDSVIEDRRRAVELTLFLSQSVPYRVFTLDDPRRLVMDFREVDFRGLDADAPNDPDWAFLVVADPIAPPVNEDGPIVIVIDPGHGGIDPGATYEEVLEADIMLALALELAAALGRIEGVQPAVTRTGDSLSRFRNA